MQRLILFCFVSALVASGQAGEAAPAVVKFTVSCDLEGTLELDGKPIGTVAPGERSEWEAVPGEHQLQVYPAVGGAPWRKLILVSGALATHVVVPLRSHVLRAGIQKDGYWRDDRTGLIWVAADNGSGLTVSQARHYCRQLRSGGWQDWRLPAIGELQTLFGGVADERGFRVIVPLRLSGWAWSATEGNEAAENWALDFGDGARASVAAGDAGLNRALCVRGGSAIPGTARER